MLNNNRGRENARGSLHRQSRRTVFLMIAGQLGAGIAIALSLGIAIGHNAAHSALVGALIGVMPNYYLAGRMLRRGRRETPEQSLRGIYVGEFIKIAFTAALFVTAIRLLNVDFLVVVATYIAMVAVNWLTLLVADIGESPRNGGRTEPLGAQGK